TGKNGATHDIDGKDQNILIVGNDDRTNMTNAEVHTLKVGRDGGSMATDTMMIVHVPADGKKATLISLPRDSYVAIPGYGKDKLNAAYIDGYDHASGTPDQKRAAGADLLIKTVQNLTGLTINHYVQVSLMGFYDISNAIGGVPINLCHAVNDPAENGHGSGFVMSAGKHVIQGVQALEFVRQRYNFPNGLGDLDRVKRQQYFLAAAFRKVASVGILFKLQSLGDAVKRNLYMDQNLDLLSLAQQMENLSANNIVGVTIPTEFGTSPDGQSILVVSPAKVQAFIDKLINPPAPATPAARPTTTPSTHSTSAGTPATKPATSSSGPAPIDSKCIN
ncbi:MAG TPA: LCP family protein, partial [Jatrophihabitans sp.]|nr:LCP family protein [Jatrophihabitans sp.]